MALVVVIVAVGALLSALSYLFASKKEKESLAYSNERTWFLLILTGVSVSALPYVIFYAVRAFEWVRNLVG